MRSRRNQIGEHGAGSDARQLIGVANKDDSRPLGEGRDESGGYLDVEHRTFVDDDESVAERIRRMFVMGVNPLVIGCRVRDKRRMNSGRRMLGELPKALRSGAGRRQKQYITLPEFHQAYNNRRLPMPGA